MAQRCATPLAPERKVPRPKSSKRGLGVAGRIDILAANLSIPAPSIATTEASEDEWNDTFSAFRHWCPIAGLVADE
ncbi:MAG TPA: hypothetical protein PLF25_01290, partial [Accumulibacter sp.]|nr:hypothetical protein [Accumulibacter sp.]